MMAHNHPYKEGQESMEKISVKSARQPAALGHQVLVQGWVRTRRDSKGGFSFIELNDGSSLANLQIVADGSLPNYESEVKHLNVGSSIAVEGEVKASGGRGQATEVFAKKLTILGGADPEAYPLQKKQHSLEKLREWAHLRPRTNTFGAVTRVRNCVSRSIHNFFQEDGFLYIHTPIITASDCEGAGALFRVTTLDLEQPPTLPSPRSGGRVEDAGSPPPPASGGGQGGGSSHGGTIDWSKDFFHKPAYLTVSGQLQVESF